jgi:hypothetical protein
VRNQSTEPQVRQSKGSSIPPQEAQIGWPSGLLAGNGPVCSQRGQTPRRRTLRVAQVAQKTPSGQAGRLVRRPQPQEHATRVKSAALDDTSPAGPASRGAFPLVLLLGGSRPGAYEFGGCAVEDVA